MAVPCKEPEPQHFQNLSASRADRSNTVIRSAHPISPERGIMTIAQESIINGLATIIEEVTGVEPCR